MHHQCPTLVAERLAELVRQLRANSGQTAGLTEIVAAVAEELRTIAGHVDRVDEAQRKLLAEVDQLEARVESLEARKPV
jgi:hypothetical protein